MDFGALKKAAFHEITVILGCSLVSTLLWWIALVMGYDKNFIHVIIMTAVTMLAVGIRDAKVYGSNASEKDNTYRLISCLIISVLTFVGIGFAEAANGPIKPAHPGTFITTIAGMIAVFGLCRTLYFILNFIINLRLPQF